jgi:hypothetical protein
MRNTILALGTVAALTFAAPAFAADSCYPCLDSSPIQGVFDSSPARGLSYQTHGSSHQMPSGHIRHTRTYHTRYHG